MAKLITKTNNVIYLKLYDKYQVPYKPILLDFEVIEDENFLKAWKKIIKRFPSLILKPLFTSISQNKINDLINKAIESDPTYKPKNLLNYFFVEFDDSVDKIKLFNSLSASSLFESIEFKNEISLPARVVPTNEPNYTHQGYLNSAIPINPNDEIGIGVNAAWNETNFNGNFIGDGTGVNFVDIEFGWIFDHEDLELTEATTIKFATNSTNNDFKNHGTSVLGIVAAKNNSNGCVGIAPNCNVSTIGINDFGHGPEYVDSISNILHLFGQGDIILIELQNGGPGGGAAIETISPVRDVISLATAIGMIIVEPAGNGLFNYDAVNPIFPELKPTDAMFIDSGAIIVGGVVSNTLERKIIGSCYGERVNCFAWYDSVYAATGPNTTNYTTGFTGTSAASAIIAGVTVVLQGIYKNKFGQILNGLQMRRILSNPAFGTASKNPAVDKVGVMPDLEKIIHSLNNPLKDIYIRDNINDIGDRHLGGISISPDIITLNSLIPSPLSADSLYGTNSGTELIYGLGDAVLKNQDNFIYVRILNKSSLPITDVTVSVYYSEVATLITPNRWNLIGSTVIPSVPANTNTGRIEFTVTDDPIVWQAANIPAAGHYCYVCIIESEDDPAPTANQIGLANDLNNFIKLIRENNNITWKNFNVIELEKRIKLPFLLVGDKTKKRLFDVYITNTLPKDAIIEFEIPKLFVEIFSNSDLKIYKKSKTSFFIRWKANKLIEFNNLILKKGFEAACKINIFFQQGTDTTKEYQVSITQLFKNNIVGKITWIIKQSAFK